MVTTAALVPTASEFSNFQKTYGLSPTVGVEIPIPNTVITSPPARKVGVYLKTLVVGLHRPLTDFQEELLRRNGCNVQMLTPNAFHKMVDLKMICLANGIIPYFFVFKYYFQFGATGDKYTIYACRGGHNLVLESKTPKNWQEKLLWVNQELLGRETFQENNFSNVILKLFPYNQTTADFLKTLQVDADGLLEVQLAVVGMSPIWCARGEMSVFFTVSNDSIFILVLLLPPVFYT